MGEDWFECNKCNGPTSDYRSYHCCHCENRICSDCYDEDGPQFDHENEEPYESPDGVYRVNVCNDCYTFTEEELLEKIAILENDIERIREQISEMKA